LKQTTPKEDLQMADLVKKESSISISGHGKQDDRQADLEDHDAYDYGPCKHEECQFDPTVLDGYLLLQEADEYVANIVLDHFEEYKEEMN